MTWSEKALKRINPLYRQILQLPFNQELMLGVLPLEKFRFYLAQDAYYLVEFGKTLSTISGRMKTPEGVLAFAEFARGAIVVEKALHENFFLDFGLPNSYSPSPSCLLYTNYIRNQAAYENLATAMAAVLPCFCIYKKVGDHIYAHQNKVAKNPYQRWIETYSGEEFGSSVQKAITITNELALIAGTHGRDAMFEAFEMASKLEWLFWESAYNMEKWKV
ncbi:MAG: TenA family protein [Cyclobacteriaceae bacterium]